jgi:[protein-PII] uridylyltransferase
MQDYFLHATKVGELTRVFLVALEARHLYKAPIMNMLFQRRRRMRAGFRVDRGRLTYADPTAVPVGPAEHPAPVRRGAAHRHPDPPRCDAAVAANLDLIDDHMRSDPEAVRIFLDLLLKHGNPERALRRMNELGVLAAFIPEFARSWR